MWILPRLQLKHPILKKQKLKAVAKVKEQKEFRGGLLNGPDDSPMIYLEEIHQLNTNEELKENGGRTAPGRN